MMQRRSYYPTNQQLISTATATSSGLASSRPGTPANDLRVENAGFRVEGSDMMLDSSMMFKASTDIELRPSADDITVREQESPRVDHHQMEKSYS
jgi:serine/threonine kinase 32